MTAETSRPKHYLYYLLGILSIFATFRAYTLEGGKTTALVWYFFPNLDFETGLTYLSKILIFKHLKLVTNYFQGKLPSL